MQVRLPVGAGSFYPSSQRELAGTIDRLLEDALGRSSNARSTARANAPKPPAGLIVPHAGYGYSGPVAATAYSLLRRATTFRRVVILGPAHFVPLAGLAVPAADRWRTPLGDVAIDGELRAVATGAGAAIDDEPHTREHATDVQLPFLQRVLEPELTALPVAVGRDAQTAETASMIRAVLDAAPETLVIVSTDLSHHRDAETAGRQDRRTADAIIARDESRISSTDACGSHALRGALSWAERDELAIRLLHLGTSADAGGDPMRVVGYGAFVIG